MPIPGNNLEDNLFMTPVKDDMSPCRQALAKGIKSYTKPRQGPTLRYFKTPCDFCEMALEEALALFPSKSALRVFLSDSYKNDPNVAEILNDSPMFYDYTRMLPRDAWMLIRDCDKGDIFYNPGA